MQKLFFVFVMLLGVFGFTSSKAQIAPLNNGIFFQAVARDNFSNPAKDRTVFVEASIIQNAANGTKVLTEFFQTTTDGLGVFSLNIGSGTRIGGTLSGFDKIDWANGPYFLGLKIAIKPLSPVTNWDYTKELIDLGASLFGTVPYSFYSAAAATVKDQVKTSDTAAMLLSYAKKTDLVLKVNLADSTTIYVTPSQLRAVKFDTTSIYAVLNQKEILANKSTNVATDATSDTKYPSVRAVKSYVDLQFSNFIIADGSVTTAKLANGSVTDTKIVSVAGSKVIGDIAGNAATATLAANATKLATPRTINGIAFDGSSNITIATGSNPIDADANTKGVVQLTGDLTGTATQPRIANGAVTNAKIADVAASKITGAVAVANGGTGATTAAGARTNLGLVIGTDVLAQRTFGSAANNSTTDFIAATDKGANNGVATLGNDGKIPSTQIPAISFQSASVVANQAAMLALANQQVGSIAIRTDNNKNYVLSALPSTTLANWVELATPTSVTSVNGNAGPNVVLTATDIAGVEIASNKSNDIAADAASTTKFPTVKSIKDYVDQQSANAGVADNSITSAKINGAIAIAKGGTGATTAAGARTNLGLVIGTDVMSATATTTLTGDVTGSGNGSFATTVNSVGGVSSSTITTLPTRVNANTASITAEITRATNAEAALDTRVTSNTASITGNTNNISSLTTSVNANTASITAEVTRATNAEAALDTRITSNTASITTNTNNISSLTTSVNANTASITAEVTRATNAEAALDTRVSSNTASITTNTNNISSLTTSVNANTASITAEVTRATNAEAALDTRISSNTASITTNTNNISSLTTSVNANTASITAEITRATNAEAALDTRITSNTTSITTNTADILLKAPINSPTFTGTPTAPTPATSDNSTQLATTAYVKSSITAANAGLSSIGSISGTSNAKGATISGTTELILTPADATNGGIVTTGSQTFAGAKTFNNDVTAPNFLGNATTATTAGNVTATSNTTLTSLSNLNTVGTITSGTWSGTTIAVANGGTGATTAAGARANLGLAIGTDVMSATATTTLTGDVTGSGNGSFATTLAASGVTSGTYGSSTAIPTFTVDTKGRLTAAGTVGITAGVSTLAYSSTSAANGGTISGTTLTLAAADGTNPGLISIGSQTINGAKTFSNDVTAPNFLGNATTATTAGNITATSNTTLTSLSNLNTVGTISSGTWSGTTIAVTNGGTGATTAAAARTNLGLVIGTDVMSATATTTLTGDVTGSGNGSFATTLAASGVTSGNYGSSTAIPTFTVDSKGRLTAAGTVGITAGVSTLAYSSTSAANGGTISGTTLTLAAADGTNPGLISIGSQTINGAKTFSNNVTAPNFLGNATTATTAGNITATSNTTLTSLSNLNTVGTITSGTWSGTTIAVANGGTGATTAAGARANLGLAIGTDVMSATATTTLTGDVTGSGNGSFATTLAASGVTSGTYGSSTTIPSITVDAKGRITSANTSSIIANAGTLTGTSLASTVTSSSLTSVGTITSGTWSGTTIAVANGGTGLTSLTAGQIPFGNGTSALGASPNLFWDNTNTRLGVGTNTPTTKLDVNGSFKAAGLSYPTSDGTAGQYLKTDGSGNIGFTSLLVAPSYTTTNRDAATFSNGALIFNSTSGNIQASVPDNATVVTNSISNSTGVASFGQPTYSSATQQNVYVQTFTTATAVNLTSITLNTYVNSSPATVIVKVFNDSDPSNGLTNEVASISKDISSTSDANMEIFTLPSTYLTTANATYTFVVYGISSTNIFYVGTYGYNNYSGGSFFTSQANTSYNASSNLSSIGLTNFSGNDLKFNVNYSTGASASKWIDLLNTVNLTSNVSGSLPIANGGTGATTAAGARTNLGLGTLSEKSTIANADVDASAAIAFSKLNITKANITGLGVQEGLTAGSGISINAGTISATGLTTSNLASNAAITNAQLANSSTTLGSTTLPLGGIVTTVEGLTSVTSTGFTGALTGNASTATSLATGRTISTTGDITYTSGSFNGTADVTGVATLAASGVTSGTYGTSTVIPTLTIDSKGRITNAGSASIIANAGTLTGTTLNPTVVSSSLTSVGTISSGTWSGTTIAVVNGGTGVTTSTGTGSVVLSNNPSLTTPNIGAATGTSLNLSSTLAAGATTLSSTLNVTGAATFSNTVTIPTGAGAGRVLTSDANGLASWSANSNGGVSSITVSATMAATDNYNLIVFSGSTASQTITLPSASLAGAGREITIKNIASVSVRVNATFGNLISDSTTTGATELNIGIEPSNNWIKAISTGTNWIILRALF